MKKKGYILTDWIFFFSLKNKEDLNHLLVNDNSKDLKDEFITWKLITVFLPLVTFLLVVVLNILTNTSDSSKFYSFLNNGSLPIISFGILTSGMPYLLEQLESYPEFHVVRRRVMSIALIFLFLSAAIYILETLSIVALRFDNFTNFILLAVSAYIFLFSSSVGYKMFLLQSKNIKDYDRVLSDNVDNLQKSLDDL